MKDNIIYPRNPALNGKGCAIRQTTDFEKYEKGWEGIFGKKQEISGTKYDELDGCPQILVEEVENRKCQGK